MSSPRLDPATLDAMVLDSEDGSWAWEELVRSDTGTNAWHAAMHRREQLDEIAERIRERPWLARMLLQLRQMGRSLQHRPNFRLEAWEGQQLFAQTLGATSTQPAQPVELLWGQVVSTRVPVGQSICLQSSATEALIVVFAMSRGTEQPLPQCEWTLEPGESPVLLVGCLTDSAAPTLLDTLSRSRSFAGILLEEAL